MPSTVFEIQKQCFAEYPSLNSFAIAVKGDRGTIRQYINGQRSGQLYKKQWKLIEHTK